MGFDWNEVPGYRDAALRDALERETAFLVPPEFICGVPVKPFTLRHIQILRALESPFFVGGIPTPIDCARFLWIVSPQFREAASWRDRFMRWRFYRGLGKSHVNYGEALGQIRDYLALAFRESPGSDGRPAAESYWSFSASVIDAMASGYGWTAPQIMATPLRQIFQLMKVSRKRNNPEAPMFSYHAGCVKNKYRRERNERMKAQCQTTQ